MLAYLLLLLLVLLLLIIILYIFKILKQIINIILCYYLSKLTIINIKQLILSIGKKKF